MHFDGLQKGLKKSTVLGPLVGACSRPRHGRYVQFTEVFNDLSDCIRCLLRTFVHTHVILSARPLRLLPAVFLVLLRPAQVRPRAPHQPACWRAKVFMLQSHKKFYCSIRSGHALHTIVTNTSSQTELTLLLMNRLHRCIIESLQDQKSFWSVDCVVCPMRSRDCITPSHTPSTLS